MEAELVEKISRVTDFSDDLVNMLTAINRDIYRPSWDQHISKLASTLVNFASHPKITYMRRGPSAGILMGNQNKTLEEYCLDLILQILLKVFK
jgi:hypothetical protein